MGRRKLEMKRIEDKNSRLVTFSKRRSGLVKKARHLSVLCDVDVAVIVFSARGKLYESCSGTTNSVDRILSRYQKKCLEAGDITTNGACDDLCKRFRTCKELLQTVDRLTQENNAEELSVNDMTELEQELGAALGQTRLRKTQLMMEYVSTLKEKEKKLIEEKEELKNQVGASAEKNGVDGGGGVNHLATNQMNPPQFITLPLFNG
ncbi:hypothetical protein QVD17_04077 [Tagetes erecta]|uniref:Uncharacterized protein n=1 Tax=Tagetes erecta TaxID=13708 RepID=A0AAD8PAF4_TARER|nr:hypothetical protein QVD17_04077 [Tagetes erecta]